MSRWLLTVLGPQLSSIHCCFHHPFNCSLPICLLTCVGMALSFLLWHGSCLSSEAGWTLRLHSQLWISHRLSSSFFPAGLGFIILPIHNLLQFLSAHFWNLLNSSVISLTCIYPVNHKHMCKHLFTVWCIIWEIILTIKFGIKQPVSTSARIPRLPGLSGNWCPETAGPCEFIVVQ